MALMKECGISTDTQDEFVHALLDNDDLSLSSLFGENYE
jgi:hypothetical protein